MTNNIYSLHCILTIDHTKKENLIVSSSKTEISLPIFKIEHPRLLHNELRYNIQNILLDKTYNSDVIKNIAFSYIDIQNELVLQYMEKYHSDNCDLNNDIFIFCGMIMENIYPLNGFEWQKFEFVKSLTNMDIITSIVDFTVQKSIL